ncbi:MAG: class I SAM-dependent methyltransferase [Pseudomonadota bacterium]
MDAKLYFDTVAPAWDDMRKAFFAPAVREKAIATAGLTSPATVADIGAGSGFVTEALASGGFSVVAVDRSNKMAIELAHRFPGVDCRQGEAQALPLETAAVDAAFANMYIHH